MHGLVIGAGIGGMALGAAFERVGISYELHEQAGELREVGAGLTLWSNAQLALDKLGALPRITALGSIVNRLEVRTPAGLVLAVTPLARAARRFGFPGSVCVHRADLLSELARLSDSRRLHLGARCSSIEPSGGDVIARFADGREARGDFLIGADGLHSVVRAHLWGAAPPRYAGYTCWRGVATLATSTLAPDTAFEAWGRGKRFSVHHCGRGRLFWWATHNAPPGGADGARGRKADVQELFATWHEPISSVIDATTEILRNDIVDRPPLRVWGRGRVTLLGDAAHPTTPNLGQGACQAIEDALVLADRLRHGPAIEEAMRRYEHLRQRRTANITRTSHHLGTICQWRHPVACWMRNTATRLTPPAASLRFLERFFRTELPVL